KVKLTEAELISAQANKSRAQLMTMVDSLTEALKLAEARLERTVIRAPVAGEVLKIMTRAGESIGANPILRLGNTKSMYAIAEVYETDIHLVKEGQKATITSKAFGDKKLEGTVERVSRLVHKNDVLRVDPTSDADSRVIEVRIKLNDSELA